MSRDLRSTESLVRALRTAPTHADGADLLDERSRALQELHRRGGVAELDAGCRLAQSPDPRDRIAGADVLAQLGVDAPTHLETSVAVLCEMLRDPSESVVAAAAIALGHRRHRSALAPLLARVTHRSAEVRHGVVHGISCHEGSAVTDALVVLARDVDRDVRSWATFALQTRADRADAVLEVLRANALDEDPEVRGEALIGLARRRDPQALTLVRAELCGEFYGDWAVEAAEALADPSLVPVLEARHARLDASTQRRFEGAFTAAIAACRRNAAQTP